MTHSVTLIKKLCKKSIAFAVLLSISVLFAVILSNVLVRTRGCISGLKIPMEFGELVLLLSPILTGFFVLIIYVVLSLISVNNVRIVFSALTGVTLIVICLWVMEQSWVISDNARKRGETI